MRGRRDEARAPIRLAGPGRLWSPRWLWGASVAPVDLGAHLGAPFYPPDLRILEPGAATVSRRPAPGLLNLLHGKVLERGDGGYPSWAAVKGDLLAVAAIEAQLGEACALAPGGVDHLAVDEDAGGALADHLLLDAPLRIAGDGALRHLHHDHVAEAQLLAGGRIYVGAGLAEVEVAVTGPIVA